MRTDDYCGFPNWQALRMADSVNSLQMLVLTEDDPNSDWLEQQSGEVSRLEGACAYLLYLLAIEDTNLPAGQRREADTLAQMATALVDHGYHVETATKDEPTCDLCGNAITTLAIEMGAVGPTVCSRACADLMERAAKGGEE